MLTEINKACIANKKLIVNAIGFQLAWFICVQGHNLYAAFAAIALLSLYQLMFNTQSKTWKALIAFSLIGYLGDGIIAMMLNLNYLGSFNINTNANDSFNESFNKNINILAPLWLLSLWLAFATTLNHSMQWLFKTPYLTVFIALFFVPISYFAGIKLSGSTFVLSSSSIPYWTFFIAEGVWWAILLMGYQKFTTSQKTTGMTHA